MKVMPIGRSAQRLGGGRMRIAAGCSVAALLLAGCSAACGSSASGSAPAGSSITVAAVPGVGDAPLYVARQQGLFQQRGLTVHLRSYHTMAEVMAALHNGQANVAVGDYADFFYEQEHDSSAPMVVVADGYTPRPTS